MRARTSTGKVVSGKIAQILVAKGRAIEVNDNIENTKLKAKDVIELINACSSIEKLQAYSNDDRATVKIAFNKKSKELNA